MLNNQDCPHGCNALGQILFRGEWYPCPIHGKKESNLLLDGKLPDGTNLFDLLQIPYEYRGIWLTDTGSLFKKSEILENCLKLSIENLQYILDTLMNSIAIENKLYMSSLYIYANPNLIDLKPYIYTIQRMAFENHMSVLPSLSINDLCGLMALQDYSSIRVESDSDVSYISSLNSLAGVGADWKLRTKLSYTDYLRCGLCIIYDNNSTTQNNLRLFSGFVEERALRGLPTYVFSTSFFDTNRENSLSNKSGSRVLSGLTPYLLLGRGQEAYAKSHGWLKTQKEHGLSHVETEISGYTLGGYLNKSNNFDL